MVELNTMKFECLLCYREYHPCHGWFHAVQVPISWDHDDWRVIYVLLDTVKRKYVYERFDPMSKRIGVDS